DVQLPMSKSEYLQSKTNGSQNDNHVPCNLIFRLYENNGQINVLTVSTLIQYGAIFSSQMDCYDGGTLTIPKYGHYMLKIENLSNNLQVTAGRFSLIRRENTENAAVLSGVFEVLAIIFGVITVLIIAYDFVGFKQMRLAR